MLDPTNARQFFVVLYARGERETAESVTAGTILEARVVDEPGHVVEVTIARPGTSMNGYVYSEGVLRAAVPLWNGAPAFLDHPTAMDLTRAGGRSLRDLVGVTLPSAGLLASLFVVRGMVVTWSDPAGTGQLLQRLELEGHV